MKNRLFFVWNLHILLTLFLDSEGAVILLQIVTATEHQERSLKRDGSIEKKPRIYATTSSI